MPIYVKIGKLANDPKKYKATIIYRGKVSSIKFGSSKHSDYTRHHDPERKKRYLARHRPRENWGISGVRTAGFWARWLLWNKRSIAASKRDIMRRFYIRFI